MQQPIRLVSTRPDDAVEALPPPVPPMPDFGSGIWSPDTAERELAAELEQILKIKPVLHPPAKPANDSGGTDADRHAEGAGHLLSGDAMNDTSEGFEWQQHDQNGEPADTASSNSPAASLQWISKARADKRRRMMRNTAGWAVSLVVGGVILGGAAYFLTGWKPDFTGLLAISQALHS